ncbi:hypothetical protein [Elizabethkingia meningoseptica]|uniref:Uncharacterized protein n=1 Tax=Elizabethkingia meningoseptica TaxID=238 RepID=A0A1T3FKU1_ELIME|nr:hypothetical protein [Elizabethkingia meningoseptica]AQX13501.1 hypothetical protein BBD35_14465 [Elizabethkingia meningoseptica]MBG0515147.1 hypothetical protein [Elizabethkingia meningoseptica]MDE5434353.1 hypothetical protein [Elizabethkingia meningoseptica]OOH96213.1 hypothetical protein BMF97_07645 [Elizabethkingia meningoseptica]OPB78443.1 hypothetical protein BAY31_16990 [Elizabethkingia meningoseptica]
MPEKPKKTNYPITVRSIIKNNFYLAVKYEDNGNIYQDVLHHSEIEYSAENMYRIMSIIFIASDNSQYNTLYDLEARQIIKELHNHNIKSKGKA